MDDLMHTGARVDAGSDRSGERLEMVREQIAGRGISSERVLEAMARVPRERFVPSEVSKLAYADRALPIGGGQTISQPYIVALMTELSGAAPGVKVLEVGTGSGYQTAVLAALGAEVYSVEIVEPLATQAASRLAELGYQNVHARVGDGHSGWPGAAPFDAILVTAAPRDVPMLLKQQLAVGGRLVVPVGDDDQELFVIRRGVSGFEEERVAAVRFVPMTGGSFARPEGFGTL